MSAGSLDSRFRGNDAERCDVATEKLQTKTLRAILPEESFSSIGVEELGTLRDEIDDAGPALLRRLGVIVVHGLEQTKVD